MYDQKRPVIQLALDFKEVLKRMLTLVAAQLVVVILHLHRHFYAEKIGDILITLKCMRARNTFLPYSCFRHFFI